MRIEIEIPKEFEEHFRQDKFNDSFERIMADIKHSLENGDCLCAGRYEYETIEMLEEALENSKPAYSVEKVVEDIMEAYGCHNCEQADTMACNECAELEVLNDICEIVKQNNTSDDCIKIVNSTETVGTV